MSDSIQFVSEAVSDLFMLVEKLQLVRSAAAKGLLSAEAIAAALEAEQAADLPYLRDNLPKALQRSIDGLGRVATIVRSMKEFAQPDAREMSAVDLNEMIENTLTIAGNEYRSIADVVTDLGPIPRVLCHAGEVGQAILNIIINAADAIGEVASAPGQRGRITVRTRLEGATVLVAISDTGAGIPEAIRDQIFDPFFTTKAIGRGTGQGLTVSRAVVADRHGGALTFETEVGRGTTFFLRFPIGGSAADPARARP